jgi:hypothetical protein
MNVYFHDLYLGLNEARSRVGGEVGDARARIELLTLAAGSRRRR